MSSPLLLQTPEFHRYTALLRIPSTYTKLNLTAERISIDIASEVGSNDFVLNTSLLGNKGLDLL